MNSDFPYIKFINGKIIFHPGDIVELPKEYSKFNMVLLNFYMKVASTHTNQPEIGIDPLGFNYIHLNSHCNVGLLVNSGKTALQRNNSKKYPNNCFRKEFLIKRIVKERKPLSFEDFIPREFVTQNIHELRNLNAKISSNVDALLDVQEEDEWEDKFDRADENVKKIFVASRLIKFILDNIKFYIPDHIKDMTLDLSRSFRVHRSASKIVKIYRNDFKKKKSEIRLVGNTNRVLAGDRELFEIILMLLVENAIKYSNDVSSIAPIVELEDAKVINATKVIIKSYGIIVPQDDQSRLFSKGFRSSVHTTLAEGTGMGLHNAFELIKLFAGSLTYICEKSSENQEVGWNCFVITI